MHQLNTLPKHPFLLVLGYRAAARSCYAHKHAGPPIPPNTIAPPLQGDYPASLRARKPDVLPRFTPAQAASLNRSLDFIAVNCFTATYVRAVPGNPHGAKESKYRDGKPIGPPTGIPWMASVPSAQEKALLYMAKAYPGMDLLVSSSGTMGIAESGTRPPAALRDVGRLRYYRGYMGAVCSAAAAGARVIGWFAWSWMDSFEWTDGFRTRFGLVHVDYAGGSLARTPKDSALWLSRHFWRL